MSWDASPVRGGVQEVPSKRASLTEYQLSLHSLQTQERSSAVFPTKSQSRNQVSKGIDQLLLGTTSKEDIEQSEFVLEEYVNKVPNNLLAP